MEFTYPQRLELLLPTIIEHVIDERSPLFGHTHESLAVRTAFSACPGNGLSNRMQDLAPTAYASIAELFPSQRTPCMAEMLVAQQLPEGKT